MNKISHPNCGHDPKDCRITTTVKSQPIPINWQPIMNGIGVVVNHEQSVTVMEYKCSVCHAEWTMTGSIGNMKIESRKMPNA